MRLRQNSEDSYLFLKAATKSTRLLPLASRPRKALAFFVRLGYFVRRLSSDGLKFVFSRLGSKPLCQLPSGSSLRVKSSTAKFTSSSFPSTTRPLPSASHNCCAEQKADNGGKRGSSFFNTMSVKSSSSRCRHFSLLQTLVASAQSKPTLGGLSASVRPTDAHCCGGLRRLLVVWAFSGLMAPPFFSAMGRSG